MERLLEIYYILLVFVLAILTARSIAPVCPHRDVWDCSAMVALTLLFALSAFRGDVGSDTVAYKEIFDEGLFTGDVGFLFLVNLVKCIKGNSTVFIAFVSFIQCSVLMLVLWKSKNDTHILLTTLFLSISSTFILFNFNTIRQGLAAYFLLLGTLNYPKNSKSVYIYYGLATCFHFSAGVYLLFPLIDRIILQNRGTLFLVICGLLAPLPMIVLSFTPVYYIFVTYANYGGNDNLFIKLVLNIIVAIVLYQLKAFTAYPLVRFYGFGVGIFILCYQSPETAKRFLMYSSIALPIIFSYIYIRIPRKRPFILLTSLLYGLYTLNHPSIRNIFE